MAKRGGGDYQKYYQKYMDSYGSGGGGGYQQYMSDLRRVRFGVTDNYERDLCITVRELDSPQSSLQVCTSKQQTVNALCGMCLLR